ncbi:MAG: Crp/Fnr family transcriptional regulator [Bacteroidota bacterium]|jgi:CRP/FNR family transcriptional regulator|nr:Crp/Fnr family transcriptional regulator [Cytophagales bacterium]MCE2955615.1 Crp/Fnr family transcriptional regulator [Flammeovirgaceae bacterium]
MNLNAEISQYLNSIKRICPEISKADLSAFGKTLSVTHLAQKDIYIHADLVQSHMGYIITGLIRSFYVDQKGDEKTVRFIKEDDYVTHYTAFISKKPSSYTFQCLEPTVIVNISFEAMQQSYVQSASMQKYGRIMAEEILKMQQARIESFLFGDAEKRYLDFLAKDPSLFNRVTLSHLCSYLGIQRQHLTRIRQKIAHG